MEPREFSEDQVVDEIVGAEARVIGRRRPQDHANPGHADRSQGADHDGGFPIPSRRDDSFGVDRSD